jgi:hypothetical protein
MVFFLFNISSVGDIDKITVWNKRIGRQATAFAISGSQFILPESVVYLTG